MSARILQSIEGARRAVRVLVAGAFALGAALAPAVQADDDLPARVGRVADVAGEVFTATEEQAGDWTAIGLNQPVTTGDNLWVAANGRAEVDYGGGQLRIGGDSSVHVSRLDDRELALFVASGRVIVRVRVLDAGDVAYVETPNTQLQFTRAGLYRIDVDPDQETTTLVVREGEATVALASGVQPALAGQTVSVTGTGATDADIRNGAGVDGFDTWSAGRDRFYERSRSASYVSRQMVGYADLDTYGAWETSPTYGPVWYPSIVVADWAPYRFGHWTWVSGFGYAWVDDAPWGYAPFHYGRWVNAGGRWGWCPGQYVTRPVWAPALVAWYGGPGWSLSTSYGSPVYGWVPLSWGEPFQPWWGRCSQSCWVRYNRPYAVNVAQRPDRPPTTYANLRVPGALTAVPGAALAGSRPVAASRVPIQPSSMPPVLAAAPPIKPLAVGERTVRPGTGGAPPLASALNRDATRRVAPAPSYVAPGAPPARAAPPFGARQVAPAPTAPPIAAPAAAPAGASPRALEPRTGDPRTRASTPELNLSQPQTPPSAAPRIVPAAPRVVPAVPPSAPASNVAPAPAPRAIEVKPRQLPRQEGISMPPPAPASRAVVPLAPPPPTPTALPPQAVPRAAGHPAGAAPQPQERPNANPRGGPQQEQPNANPRGGPQQEPR